MRVRTTLMTAVIATVAAVALTGCTPAAQGGAAGATSNPRPTATSTPATVRTPAPACSELASPDQVTALVGGSGQPQRFEHLGSGGAGRQAAWSVWAANGAVCGWGDRGAEQLVDAVLPGSVLIEVAPGMESAWNALVQENDPSAGSAYDGGVSRGGSCADGAWCSTDVLVGGAWLGVTAASGDAPLDEADFHAFVQGVVTRYAAQPAPTVLPTHTRSCEAPGLRDAVAGAFGSAGTPDPQPSGFTLVAGVVRAGYQSTCDFREKQSGRGWTTTITVLDGVPASLVAAYRTGTDHPGSRPVDVAALGADASGLFEPTADSERTIVDVLVDGRWLSIVTYGTDDTGLTVALAQALLAGEWIRG